jgi:cyclopropane fatty-acyl-phospholipid synthase-like methyltransferase
MNNNNSNGYEEIALEFLNVRSKFIGVAQVLLWSKSLPESAEILDLGCGSGIPISKTLIDRNFKLYGIDASETLSEQFRINFPNNDILCETIEVSDFYNKEFQGIIAWGLVFLLSPQKQTELFQKVAKHLQIQGKFLFTAPFQNVSWKDLMTNRISQSLGTEKYRELLLKNGIEVVNEYDDEVGNHYYSCQRII